jgi:lipoate---protein ligase
MKFLELTLPTIAENLALDEALLETVDSNSTTDAVAAMKPDAVASSECLRLWHATSPFVVLGRSSKIEVEIDQREAERSRTPLYRRISGGASIVAGPGCMFYTLILDLERRPHLRMLDQAHAFVMNGLLDALRPLQPHVRFDGTCDLAIEGRKVSGNAVRIGRDWMLYHGTLLLDMDLSLITRLLRHPPREPDYRAGRNHEDFVANLHVPADELTLLLRTVWQAEEPLSELPKSLTQSLAIDRYESPHWNRDGRRQIDRVRSRSR